MQKALMKQTDPQLKIRLPLELKERIEDAARHSNRSMNAEIVSRLDLTFAQDDFAESDFSDDAKMRISDDNLDFYMTMSDFKLLISLIDKKVEMTVRDAVSDEIAKFLKMKGERDAS